MSVNRYLPHILVVPEDDANRQLANGFVLEATTHQIQVLTEVGGWRRVLDTFVQDHIRSMGLYNRRLVILLLDFYNDVGRLQTVRNEIPPALNDRVFILGVLTEPEELKRAGLGSYEVIGQKMAIDCRDGTDEIWSHNLLHHNRDELARLNQAARGFIF